MPTKKQIQPGEKVPLKLTAAERKLILTGVTGLDQEFEQIIEDTPAGKPVMMTLDDLDDFSGYIAAEANHCGDKKKEKKLDAVFDKVQRLLETHTDEEPPQPVKSEDARKEKMICDQAVRIAEFAATALVAAEELRIKTKPLEHFTLSPAQREVLVLLPGVEKSIKDKLLKKRPLTVAEVASITMAVADDLPDGGPQKQIALLMVANHLMERLQEGIMAKAEPSTKKKSKRRTQTNTDVLYQFKITLIGSDPPIWRRIQVLYCTLDELHDHIQRVMGWENAHLHQFKIKRKRYGDPQLLDNGFGDLDCIDSTTTMVSDILPKAGKRFTFSYEYDFGDGWQHEILYEGSPSPAKGKKYPLCLEGERACPPEDIGGVWGYAEYLEALADPQHERHKEFMEWSRSFDPDEFDAKKATKEMKKGWRTGGA